MREELVSAIDGVERDAELKVLVMTGKGKAFGQSCIIILSVFVKCGVEGRAISHRRRIPRMLTKKLDNAV